MGPTVEALRLPTLPFVILLLLPIDERDAGIGLVHAIDDQVEPGGDFLDEGFVVQNQAQPDRTVEPIGALFQRPAGAVGSHAKVPFTPGPFQAS